MNRIISYPRSGNHWVRFIIEFLSRRPTDYLLNENDGPIYKNTFYFDESKVPSPIRIINKKPIFFKQHDIESHPEVKNDEKVILIVRRPKEAIIRHNGNLLYSPKLWESDKLKMSFFNEFDEATLNDNSSYYFLQKNIQNIDKAVQFAIKNNIPIINQNKGTIEKEIMHLLSSKDIDDYFRLIQFYDDFSGDKLLVRYEDLINKCEDVAKDIHVFLKKYVMQEDLAYPRIGASKLNYFIRRKEYFSHICKGAKNREWIGSASENDLNYWSNLAKSSFKDINLNYFDQYIWDNYKYLIEKYNITT